MLWVFQGRTLIASLTASSSFISFLYSCAQRKNHQKTSEIPTGKSVKNFSYCDVRSFLTCLRILCAAWLFAPIAVAFQPP